MLLIIPPFSVVLSIRAFKLSLALFGVFYPVALIISIFEVIICSKALLIAIHPLTVVNDVLPLLTSWRCTQQNASTMLLAPFEISSILKILLCEVINPSTFNPLTVPLTIISISVGKCIKHISFCYIFTPFNRGKGLSCKDLRLIYNFLTTLPLFFLYGLGDWPNIKSVAWPLISSAAFTHLIFVRGHSDPLCGRLKHVILFCLFYFCKSLLLSVCHCLRFWRFLSQRSVSSGIYYGFTEETCFSSSCWRLQPCTKENRTYFLVFAAFLPQAGFRLKCQKRWSPEARFWESRNYPCRLFSAGEKWLAFFLQ